MIKLICSDLDGTLLNEKGKLDESFFEIVEQLLDKGIIFAACSGRLISTLNTNFSKVNKDIILLGNNGASVEFNKNKKTIHEDFIDEEIVCSTIDYLRKNSLITYIATKNYAIMDKKNEELFKAFNNNDVPIKIVDDMKKHKKGICRMGIFAPEGITKEIDHMVKEDLGDKLECQFSGYNWLDFMSKGTNKGKGIKMIQKNLNIKPEETMVFGDFYNDISMFKRSYYSYAMGQAPDDVKKYANFVTDTNKNNGVLKVITNLLNKNCENI